MALAADSPQVLVTGDMNSIPIIDNDIVYEGAMVGLSVTTDEPGYGKPLAAGDVAADEIFLGHSIFKVDNTGGAKGAKNIRLRTGRYRLLCALAGVITDVGKPVYASDDETLSLTNVDKE
ncbi:unnamed protein product, partial [marine sediment metagenome]